jgi:hypothetical protein
VTNPDRYDPGLNRTYAEMASHYGTAILAARPRRRLPILLATGFAELEGSEAVDVARLAKPYTQAQLATEIAHLLPVGRHGL